MMNDTLFVEFGGLTFAFTGRVPPIPGNSLLPPFVVEQGTPDIYIHIYQCADLDISRDAQLLYASGMYRILARDNRLWAECRSLEGQALRTYAVLHVNFNAPDRMSLQILQPDCTFTMDHVLSNLMMESLLLAHDRAILHAASIGINGRAILFTAPSGTGKSTQAQLWHRYRGAEILNGDKILLSQENGVQLACGLPYAGTSGISQNCCMPIGAIVVLSQGAENRLEPMPFLQAVKKLLSQICLQPWRQEDISRALNIAQRLATSLPIYHLSCLPDESAVLCLEQALK